MAGQHPAFCPQYGLNANLRTSPIPSSSSASGTTTSIFSAAKEHGADINPEVIFSSPITNDMIANAPSWLYWTLQPRPTLGAAINTAGDTDQFYPGATWSWMLVSNIINDGDGIVLGYFFGPGFNPDLGDIGLYRPHLEWRPGDGKPKHQRCRPAHRLSVLGRSFARLPHHGIPVGEGVSAAEVANAGSPQSRSLEAM